MLPDTILHIANEKDFHWLLQPELKAIKDGLIYVEDKDSRYRGFDGKYRGYLNAHGQRQGVGIVNCGGMKYIGEWHEDNLHGIAKTEWENFWEIGDIWWGQYKHGKIEGYFIKIKLPDGTVDYCQYKNDELNGYGI
jgi:hypothetical protein